MSAFVNSPTKTISLRIPTDSNEFLEEMARRTGRTKSNYIKWLIQQEKRKVSWPTKNELAEIRQVGKKGLREHGLNSESLTDQDVYNFFKGL